MTLSTQTGSSPNSPVPALRKGIRFAIGGNIRILILAAIAIGFGLAFNWSWLVGVGIAPVILSVLPCVAMCALGLCMAGRRGQSCEGQPSTPDSGSMQSKEPIPPAVQTDQVSTR